MRRCGSGLRRRVDLVVLRDHLGGVKRPIGDERAFDLWTSCYTPRELRLMAAAAGLDVVGVWSVTPGTYEKRPPDLDHPELLLIAQRVAS